VDKSRWRWRGKPRLSRGQPLDDDRKRVDNRSVDEPLDDFVLIPAIWPIVVQTKRQEIDELDAADQWRAEKQTANPAVAHWKRENASYVGLANEMYRGCDIPLAHQPPKSTAHKHSRKWSLSGMLGRLQRIHWPRTMSVVRIVFSKTQIAPRTTSDIVCGLFAAHVTRLRHRLGWLVRCPECPPFEGFRGRDGRLSPQAPCIMLPPGTSEKQPSQRIALFERMNRCHIETFAVHVCVRWTFSVALNRHKIELNYNERSVWTK